MLALEKPSKEHQIEELKVVADQLSRANCLLLKPLLAVLHRISQNAETNRMDSRNLAICVGPNLLSPGTGNAEGDERQGRPGAAQEDALANHSPEPEVACGPPAAEMQQQPSERSPSGRRAYATCASAPPLLPPWKNDRSTMDRSYSEPALSCQVRSEGSRRHQKQSRSADNVAVGQQELRLEHEALQKQPAMLPAQFCHGAPPQTSSRRSLDSALPTSRGPSTMRVGPAAIPSRGLWSTRTT
ncbi:uncharacterized protein [Apteryx mantelli]|uniref:Rho-GAP domain-containing protein n=1 Tax=Apteryx mantelli TaxID=2696672 RepID=A0ABM4EE10_9AVES